MHLKMYKMVIKSINSRVFDFFFFFNPKRKCIFTCWRQKEEDVYWSLLEETTPIILLQ